MNKVKEYLPSSGSLYKTLRSIEKFGPTSIKVCQNGKVILYKKLLDKNVTMMRFDLPHNNFPYEHVNVSPKYFNIAEDPHLKLPQGTLSFLGPIAKGANKIVSNVDVIKTCVVRLMLVNAILQDIKNETTRNTAECLIQIASCNASLIAAGKVGIAASSIFGGGIIPLIVWAASMYGSSKVADNIREQIRSYFDTMNYGTQEFFCEKCGANQKLQKYEGEKHECVEDLTNDGKFKVRSKF